MVACRLRTGDADADLRRRARQHERLEVLPPRLHVDGVLVRARDDVGAAADHGFERARAARKIADAHVESLVLEEAQALGEGERQVIERGFAADRDMHVALFDLSMNLRGCGQQSPRE